MKKERKIIHRACYVDLDVAASSKTPSGKTQWEKSAGEKSTVCLRGLCGKNRVGEKPRQRRCKVHSSDANEQRSSLRSVKLRQLSLQLIARSSSREARRRIPISFVNLRCVIVGRAFVKRSAAFSADLTCWRSISVPRSSLV